MVAYVVEIPYPIKHTTSVHASGQYGRGATKKGATRVFIRHALR